MLFQKHYLFYGINNNDYQKLCLKIMCFLSELEHIVNINLDKMTKF